ncbi:unnamed protein product [Lampetra fluviatilis]
MEVGAEEDEEEVGGSYEDLEEDGGEGGGSEEDGEGVWRRSARARDASSARASRARPVAPSLPRVPPALPEPPRRALRLDTEEARSERGVATAPGECGAAIKRATRATVCPLLLSHLHSPPYVRSRERSATQESRTTRGGSKSSRVSSCKERSLQQQQQQVWSAPSAV